MKFIVRNIKQHILQINILYDFRAKVRLMHLIHLIQMTTCEYELLTSYDVIVGCYF